MLVKDSLKQAPHMNIILPCLPQNSSVKHLSACDPLSCFRNSTKHAPPFTSFKDTGSKGMILNEDLCDYSTAACQKLHGTLTSSPARYWVTRGSDVTREGSLMIRQISYISSFWLHTLVKTLPILNLSLFRMTELTVAVLFTNFQPLCQHDYLSGSFFYNVLFTTSLACSVR